jgi:hypothetical protein
VVSNDTLRQPEGLPHFEYLAYLSRMERADERTRTADLPSLRVIRRALQGFAQPCKSRKSRRFSLLRFARCCAVLRSRWYQSGIRRHRFSVTRAGVPGEKWSRVPPPQGRDDILRIICVLTPG